MYPSRKLQKKISDHYQPGMTPEQLATAAGCRVWTAYFVMADIVRDQAVLAEHQRGLSLAAMAEQFQVSIPTVWRALKRALAREHRQQKKAS